MKKYLAVYGKPRYLGLVEYDGEIDRGAALIVESVRGEELATSVGEINDEQEAQYRLLRNAAEHGDGMVKNSEPVVTDLKFLSFAEKEDTETAKEYRDEETAILQQAKQLLKPHNLEMKLIDVEFLRAKRKLFFYFSSEQRVDFRAYVRDLAREFKTRIELRQVGVRDEAKIIRGVGPCGQPCCCSYWLNQFAPICIKMVKEQNLALNPAKISGICGRLMCCMCYEYDVYHEAWEGFPNPGSKIKTPSGSIIVSGIDLPAKSLKCFIPGKGEIKVPKEKFEEFKATVTAGEEWIVPEEAVEEPPVRIQDLFPHCMQRPASTGTEPKRGCACAERAASAEKAAAPSSEEQEHRREGQSQHSKRRRKRAPKRDQPQQPQEEKHQEHHRPHPPKEQQPRKESKETAAAEGERPPKKHFQRRRRPAQQKNSPEQQG